MNTFNKLKELDTECKEKTLNDAQLKMLSDLIQKGLETVHYTVKQEIVRPEGNAVAIIANWNLHQLNGAYDATITGNYAASVSNIRACFEGIIFMHKYCNDVNAAEQWIKDLNYESDKMHAIVKELSKKGEKQFTQYYEHYRNLSKLAHPYPKIRFLFSTQEKGNTLISLGGTYRKKWAGVLLSEILFSINGTLTEIKKQTSEKTLKEIETFEKQYKQFSPIIYKYFAELKVE